MLEPIHLMARLQGCDATHRADILETHLTHGCIELFRQFSRVRKGCVGSVDYGTRTFQPLSEGALRTLAVTVA